MLIKGEFDIFCVECGNKLLDQNASFCSNCGHAQEKKNGSVDEITKNAEQSIVASKEQRKKNPKKKVWSIIAATIVLLIIGTYGVTKFMTDPMKKLMKMNEAVEADEQSDFLSFIEFDEDILLDKESYFSWIKDNEWDDVHIALQTIFQEGLDVETPTRFTAHTVEDEPMFYVDVTPYIFGLFETYTIHAAPTELLVPDDALELAVEMNEEKIDLNDTEKGEIIYTVYPGEHDFYASSTEDEEVLYDEVLLVEPYASLYLPITDGRETYTFQTDSMYENAILYVDGKKSKQTLEQMVSDGTLKARDIQTLHAEWDNGDGKMVRSNTIYMDDMSEDDTLSFEFDERNTSILKTKDEELLDVGSFVLSFRDAYEFSVNHGDYEYIEDYLQKKSHAEKDLKQFIEDMNKGNYYYDFEENTITDVKKKKDGIFEVKTNEKFIFHDEDGLVYDYDRVKKYFIEEKEDTYKIVKIDYIDTKKKVR